MGRRRARKTPKPNNKKNTGKSEGTSGHIDSARMHMLHAGPKVSPRMEELMRKAIERPSKDNLTIPVMDAIQRQMGNQFAVRLIHEAMQADSSDYTSLRTMYEPGFKYSNSDRKE